MILFIVLAGLTLVFMLFPFFLGRQALDTKDERALYVKEKNSRDPRYFSHSFTAMVKDAPVDHAAKEITLSRKEPFVDENSLPADGTCDKLVLAKGYFAPNRVHSFSKEIYAQDDAVFPGDTLLRAIACEGNLVLGQGCRVVRWADGEKSLRAQDNCSLGMSASSGNKLYIGCGCEFRRLYAQEINIAAGESQKERAWPPDEITKEISYDYTQVEDLDRIENTIVARGNLVIGEYSTVVGSVKSLKNIRVKRGAVITGNLFADGDIVVEDEVDVCGTVFSQQSVYLGPGTRVGRRGKIKSVVAREDLLIAQGAYIFGYACCEKEGKTIEAADYFSAISDKF